MNIRLSSTVWDALLAQALAIHPDECCGILLGRGMHIDRVQPAANVHPDTASHFEIDPRALIDAHRQARSGGPEIVGYYHSHPRGPAEPSATDWRMAAGDGKVWAILAERDIRFWIDGKAGFQPLSHSLYDG